MPLAVGLVDITGRTVATLPKTNLARPDPGVGRPGDYGSPLSARQAGRAGNIATSDRE